jgi:beta-glucanase (GH16 family)
MLLKLATTLALAVAPVALTTQPRTTTVSATAISAQLTHVGHGTHRLVGHVNAHEADRVALQRRSCSSCSWRTVDRQTSKADSGAFRFDIDAPGHGTSAYRAVVARAGRDLVTRSYSIKALWTSTHDDLPGWGKPSWHDEFNGRRVDASRWNVHDGDYLSWEKSSLYAKQVRQRDGKLLLTAQRVNPNVDRFGRSWASGYLDTIPTFTQRYGRWEMSARLPTTPNNSRGLWPAFWLRDTKGPGEIDIMESWGTPTADTSEDLGGNYAWTVHSDTSGTGKKVGGLGRRSSNAATSRGFHRYAVEWTPAGMRFYFDDRLVGSVVGSSTPWLTTSFPGTASIRLNLAVGSTYWGEPDARTKSPATMAVEYVRVWPYRG